MWSESLWAFVRLYWQQRQRAIEQWRPTAQQKRLYLHHQGEFQHQNCTVGTVHDSDHEGVVRIFVRHSYHSNELFTLYYITRHNISYTRSVSISNELFTLYYITRHNFSYTRSVSIFTLNNYCTLLCWISNYPRNAIFPEAEGRVEYCIPRVVINLISNTEACNNCFIINFSKEYACSDYCAITVYFTSYSR